MKSSTPSAAAFADTKPHYELLDGLRGVAALLVIWYHVFEGFSFAGGGLIRTINHGYLAVDFFFMLSGFVLSYAYDDRWGKGLNIKGFFKRRLIRLHPMLVMGMAVGAVTFAIQGCVQWDGSKIPVSLLMLTLLLSMFMIPAVPGCSYEVRGNGEMFPLNGPSWSLFFEYIGNIIYALIIRRLPKRALTILAAALAVALAWFNISDVSGYGSLGVGWTLDGLNFWGGLLRMLTPLTIGMVLARNYKPSKIRGAFWICSATLIILFHVPYMKPLANGLNINGIYEMFCLLLVFPAIVWTGASGIPGERGSRSCKFLGDLSYPLYITHYPFMYLFYAWLIKTEQYTLAETWPVAIGVCVWAIIFAVLCLKLYDEPVRKRLRNNKKQG